MRTSKGFTITEVLILAFIFTSVAVVGILVWENQANPKQVDTTYYRHKESSVSKNPSSVKKSVETIVSGQGPKEYCMPHEGFCLRNDTGYTLESTVISNVEPFPNIDQERITIKDKNNFTVAKVETTFPQLGGGCEPGSLLTQYSISATKTDATVNLPDGSTNYESSQVYAVQFVTQENIANKKVMFFPTVALTNELSFILNSPESCPNTVYLGYVRHARTVAPEGNRASLYAVVKGEPQLSKAEAEKVLQSEKLKNVYAIFKTAHYK